MQQRNTKESTNDSGEATPLDADYEALDTHEKEPILNSEVILFFGHHALTVYEEGYLETQIATLRKCLEVPDNKVAFIIEHSECSDLGSKIFEECQIEHGLLYGRFLAAVLTDLQLSNPAINFSITKPLLPQLYEHYSEEELKRIFTDYKKKQNETIDYIPESYRRYQSVLDEHPGRCIFVYEATAIEELRKGNSAEGLLDDTLELVEAFTRLSKAAFHDENVDINTELQNLSSKFGGICEQVLRNSVRREKNVTKRIVDLSKAKYQVLLQYGLGHKMGIVNGLKESGLSCGIITNGKETSLTRVLNKMREGNEELDWRNEFIELWKEYSINPTNEK